MNLLDLILTGGLLVGGHELGHEARSEDLNIPLDWNIREGQWRVPKGTTKKDLSDISGAGFALQDILAERMEKPEARLANLLHKASYLTNFPRRVGGNDLTNIKNYEGNRLSYGLLGASALADLYKWRNPDSTWDLNFTTFDQGAPGLLFRKRF